nr:sigma-54-dependent Fis family transcriptional regulator [Nitrospirota bacterium]
MALKLWWGKSQQPHDRDLIGKSAPMRALRRLMYAYAPYDVPLLLEGEEGTGKRFVAQIVHSLSPYRRGPFIAVDCSALSDMMLAVELFGCAPGFCVGLAQALPGKMELARGGTLLLEHVEILPMWIQKRLLQIVETRSVTRMGMGGEASIPVHVRILASTTACPNRPAPGQSQIGLTDYLSGGFPLKLPPLRERRGDISLLSGHFLTMANRELGKQVEGFSPVARTALEAYSWPGNLRELYSVVQSAVLAADRRIRPEQLPLPNPLRQVSHVRSGDCTRLKRDRTPVPSASQTRAEDHGQRH